MWIIGGLTSLASGLGLTWGTGGKHVESNDIFGFSFFDIFSPFIYFIELVN
jgi:hypothetical protein